MQKEKQQDETIKQSEEKKSAKTSNYILYILLVLRNHSSKNEPLSQTDIAEKVLEQYGEKIDRKTVGRNLKELVSLLDDEFGKALGYTIEFKNDKDGTVPEKMSDIYLTKDTGITDDEMQYLIDTLVFSKSISYMQCKDLVDKLVTMSREIRSDNVKCAKPLPKDIEENKEFLQVFGMVTKAIKDKKQIDFRFSVPGYDGTETVNHSGFSPYELVNSNSRYYMIGAYDTGHSYLFRVDFMHDVQIKSKAGRPMNQVEDLKEYMKDGIDLVKYLGEHIHMYRKGKADQITFLIDKDMVYHVYDWFGNKNPYVKPYEKDPGKLKVTVTVIKDAMLFWLLQYGKCTEVIHPSDFRKEVRETVEGMLEKYKK